jgi:hypothetical protein
LILLLLWSDTDLHWEDLLLLSHAAASGRQAGRQWELLGTIQLNILYFNPWHTVEWNGKLHVPSDLFQEKSPQHQMNRTLSGF